MSGIDLYPVMLRLKGKSCMIAGGGQVAQRKAAGLIAAGAAVTVISPEATAAIASWSEEAALVWVRRAYAVGDNGYRQALSDEERPVLVFAATDNKDLNERICREAERAGILACNASAHDTGSFMLPAVVRRGSMVISVSSGGSSPAGVRRIAEDLDAAYGEQYELYLDVLTEFRMLIMAKVEDGMERGRMLKAMGEWDLLSAIRAEARCARDGDARDCFNLTDWKRKAVLLLQASAAFETINKLGLSLKEIISSNAAFND